MRIAVLLVVTLCTLACAQSPTTQPYRVELADWVNGGNGRSVPVKLYMPATGEGPWPVVVVSHGLGGSREGLAYLGQTLASNGYVSVHLQHVGSDESVWKGVPLLQLQKALTAAASGEQLINRVEDVKFALDEITRQSTDSDSPLFGKVDLDKIAMAGHSFGAVTTQVICGQSGPSGDGGRRERSDARIKCGVVLSPSPARLGEQDAAFASIHLPMLFATGTKDQSHIRGDTKPQARRVPFDHVVGIDAYLAIFDDADHAFFNGRPRADAKEKLRQDVLAKYVIAFLDAYLKDDEAAKKSLRDGEVARLLKGAGTFEMK